MERINMETRLTGDGLAIARRLRGISQLELARRLGIHASDLSEIENRRRPVTAALEAAVWRALSESR